MRVYRIVRAATPLREDFLSDRERRKRPRDLSIEGIRRHDGLSVWSSEGWARTMARRFPRLGTHIAVIELPSSWLEPFPSAPDHLTAYGDPDELLRRVVDVVSVG